MIQTAGVRLSLRSGALSLTTVLLLGPVSCSSSDVGSQPDSGGGEDAMNAAPDAAGPGNVTPDAGSDAGTNTGNDSGADATGSGDATIDAGTMGSADATVDAGNMGSADATPDVGNGRDADAATDGGTLNSADAVGPDGAEASAGPDGSLSDDSGDGSMLLDASADAAADVGPDAAAVGPRLVGYWKFDELTGTVAHDSSGNGNDGMLTAGAMFLSGGFSSAQFSDPGSLQLDGAGGTAVLGVAGMPAVDGPKTISLWINYTAVPTVNETVLALTDSALTCGVQVGFRGGSLVVWGWGGNPLVIANAPATGWHNLVYVFDGTTNSLYVDVTDGGSPVTTRAAPQSCPVVEGVVGTWATHAPPYDEYYGGVIDDLRIYSGVLDGAQIRTLAAGGDLVLGSADGGADAAVEAGDAGVADAVGN